MYNLASILKPLRNGRSSPMGLLRRFTALAVCAIAALAPPARSQTNTYSNFPLTPDLPFVDLDANPADYDLKNGEIDFHINDNGAGVFEISGAVSIQAPAQVTAYLDPNYNLILSPPAVFTAVSTVVGAASVSVTLLVGYGQPDCITTCAVPELNYFKTTPNVVALSANITILHKSGYSYTYEATYYWDTSPGAIVPSV